MPTWDQVQPILRHVLQLFAGILVSRGVLDDGNAELIVGGVLSIATVVWWYISKPSAGGPTK